MKNLTNINNIKCFIFDYDGVISDGKILMIESGEGIRRSDSKDGYAIHNANKCGYRIAVISGGRGETIRKRMNDLGVVDVFLGVSNKREVFEKYLEDNLLDTEEVLYMGDDIPDYEVMKQVGIAACPADACQEIKNISHYISPINGGHGCVRDVIEQTMKIQGKWMLEDAYYW